MLFAEQESVDTIVRSVLAVGTAVVTTADILKTRYFTLSIEIKYIDVLAFCYVFVYIYDFT